MSFQTSVDRAPRAEPWPLEGGTLAVGSDGRWALAAQPDRGTVAVVDLTNQRWVGELVFGLGDRPGRIAQSPSGAFYIVLSGAGSVATFSTDSLSGHIIPNLCTTPKSVAFDGETTFVACADGLIVTLKQDTVVARFNVASDARDIVVYQHQLYVSRFKTAQMIEVTESGDLVQTLTPSMTSSVDGRTFSPTVGWRAVWSPSGPLLVHQESQMTAIVTDGLTGTIAGDPTNPEGPVTPPTDCAGMSPYNAAGSCSGDNSCDRSVVNTVVTEMSPAGAGTTHFVGGSVGVDMAFDPGTGTVAVVAAGSQAVMTSTMVSPNDVCDPGFNTVSLAARPVAVAFTPGGLAIVQTRNPATLTVLHGGPSIALPLEPDSAGFNLFHTEATPRGIACASCHPAGLEDGHTWQFVPQGARRTQSLAGGISASAPYHWDGAFNDIPTLLQEVMVNRMGGAPVSSGIEQSLVHWLDAVPAPAPLRAANDVAASRGRALFMRQDVGCASCHVNPRPSASFDVGTGRTSPQAFQVPNLQGVAARLPLMHDGCADTLEARFEPGCGGTAHGNTAALSAAERADLIAYLESL